MYMACIEDYNSVFGFGNTIEEAQKKALKRLNKSSDTRYSLDKATSYFGMWCIEIPKEGFTESDVKTGSVCFMKR